MKSSGSLDLVSIVGKLTTMLLQVHDVFVLAQCARSVMYCVSVMQCHPRSCFKAGKCPQ